MAKAESILDLIDVKFQDATNHVSFVSDDIMGLVMPYYWGESDKVSVHNKTTFYEMYPESLPIGVKTLTDADRDIYSGYAQVKAYFAHGGGQVEVYRPSKGFGFQRMTIKEDGVSDFAFSQDGKQHDESAQVSIALKYSGFVPQSLASGFDNIAVKVEPIEGGMEGYDGTDVVRISVQGCKASNGDTYVYTEVNNPSNVNPKKKGWYVTDGTDYVLTEDETVVEGHVYYKRQIDTRAFGEYADLEIFEGSTNPLANISGENIYLENVVNSQFIDVRVFGAIDGSAITETTKDCLVYDNNEYTQRVDDDVKISQDIADGIVDGYKYFRDFETSNCTLVINPYVNSTQTRYDDIDAAIATLAEYRKNVMAVIGYPVNLPYVVEDTTVTPSVGIVPYFKNNAGKGYKFCIAVQGREIITLFGYRYTLNCVAGYCGKMINVAKEAHLNQIASGYIYGTYGGSLKESLLSGDVIDLMELGINSVYTSKRGNIIWGTRTMYSKQSSYFGKTNVMRVCSAILKNIYPIAVETLHTDAASNPITRASLSTMLNSVLDTFIANQDLHADSIADCSDSINTDYLTKGGTVLNIILRLHFIGLVERVSIKIIATDTSVTAEFV